MLDAACIFDDPFFYDDDYHADSPPPEVHCGECSVRAHCLNFAFTNNFEGVWGGTTWKQRQRFRRKQRRAHCPDVDCRSTEIKRGATADTCGSCGLSWPNVRDVA